MRIKKLPLKTSILFAIIVLIGLALRYYHIEQVFAYGWDQTRDAYQVVKILHGTILLDGPKIGVGNVYLGPLYFYLLAPFFFFTNLDPIASQYLNIFLCALAFVAIFFVTKKLFSLPYAFLAIGMYAINNYVANLNRTPWNVSLVPSLSFLIFYFLYQTFTKKTFLYSALLMTCCGMFFHAHFTAFVFPIIIAFLWLINKDKVKLLKLFVITLPFYFLWYIPTIISNFSTSHSQYFSLKDFLTNYFVGFHLQFMLYRLPDVVIQFRSFLLLPHIADYLFIAGLVALYFFTKRKLEIQIIIAWVLATLLLFGTYGGPISDYYFFFTLPAVLYGFFIVVDHFVRLHKPATLIILSLFLLYYTYINLPGFAILKRDEGLAEQKTLVQTAVKKGEVIQFNEGDIRSYLYYFYTNKL